MNPAARVEICDVLVVGGGGSGLAAAVSAAEHGARVLVIERASRPGGTTNLSVGSIAAAGTALQRRAGVTDSVGLHLADVERLDASPAGFADPALRALAVAEAPGTVEWLAGHGVRFVGPQPWPGTSAPRMLNAVPAGRAYPAALQRAARRLGVRVRTGVAAHRLVLDGVRVAGAQCQDEAGTELSVAAAAVVLATGYFHGDPQLAARYISADAPAVEPIEEHQLGDGHRMAAEAGAPLVNMGLGSLPEFRFVSRPSAGLTGRLPVTPAVTWVLRLGYRTLPPPVLQRMVKGLLTANTAPTPRLFAAGAILVNAAGERFADELSEFTYAVARQPGKVCFLVFDQDVARQFAAWPDFVSTVPGLAYACLPDYRRTRPDIYTISGSVSRLAARAGISPAGLAQTITGWNQAVDAGLDGAYGRAALGAGIRTPPFHVLGPAKSWFVDSRGGPALDESCAVLDAGREPIPGLYAAGALGNAALRYGGAGFDLAWAFSSGRIAGRSAAQFARGPAGRPG
jgi:FAD binding domain